MSSSFSYPDERSPEATITQEADPVIDLKATRVARFVHGSIMRHVLVMAGTGAVGLMAVFAVDLLNFWYISHLHDPGLTAAIGFAAALGYVQIAVSIGMTVGLGALIGRLIGARRTIRARRFASAFMVVMAGVTAILGCLTAVFASVLLNLLGARGEALEHATGFLHLVSPALPLVSCGMAQSALLRCVGDARRSMQVTLVGALVSVVVDPILIFGFHMALTGAAISTILSRGTVVVFGFFSLRNHKMMEWPRFWAIAPATRQIGAVALPAIATNLATPVGGLFTTHFMSHFGLEAISGQATIERIVPVAFAFVFALTGSVGPVMSQNLGAGRKDRVQETLFASLKLTGLCVLITWGLLAAFHTPILYFFAVKGIGIQIVTLFCCWLVASYFFVGLLFVSNTAFNNLGYPLYSTAFNWGRATLGTIPFVWVGSYYGPIGILVGQALGVVMFGSFAALMAFRVIKRI